MFEGVYMNADVWINGEFLGNHPYGYTSFWFDISHKIKFEKENVLTVKVKNEGEKQSLVFPVPAFTDMYG